MLSQHSNIAVRSKMFFSKPYVLWSVLLISALLTPFTFAPYNLFWLMPVLLAVLIVVLLKQPKHILLGAYFWAITAYTAQFYWIDIALHDIAGLNQFLAVPLTLMLPAYLAIYPTVTFWLFNKFKLSEKTKVVFVLPALWTVSEFIRERALTGFGWGAVGYSQIAQSPLAGYAPIGGILLVTFFTVFSAACLAWLWIETNKSFCIKILFCLCGLWLSGIILLQCNFTKLDGTQATVALAQGNIKQSLKWDENNLQAILQRYFDQVAESRADIVILPETAIPIMRQAIPELMLAQFSDMARQNGSALATGMPQYTANGRDYQNAVVSLSQNGVDIRKPPFYAKNHLVPFGEYIPLPNLMGWIYQLMHMPLAGFSKGGADQSPLLLANQRVAFNICYEDGFGDELIRSAKQSSLLANISDMGWYGHSAAMYQQLQQSQTRALELGRYMVRATNNGVTAIIDPKGKVIAQLTPDKAAVLQGTILGYQGSTPYMWLGSSWPLMILLCLLLILGWFYGYRYNKRKNN